MQEGGARLGVVEREEAAHHLPQVLPQAQPEPRARPAGATDDAAEPARHEERQHELGAGQRGGAQQQVDLPAQPARGDEHEPLRALRELVGELHRHAAAERVPDDRHVIVPEGGEQVAHPARVGAERVVAARLSRGAVPEEVRCDHRVLAREPAHRRGPRVGARRDPVDQHDRRPGPRAQVAHPVAVQRQLVFTDLQHVCRPYPAARRRAHVCDGRHPYGPMDDALYLDGRALTAVPAAVRGMRALRHLDLRGNRLAALPGWLRELPALESLSIGENPLRGIPPEVTASAACAASTCTSSAWSGCRTRSATSPSCASSTSGHNRLATLPPGFARLGAPGDPLPRRQPAGGAARAGAGAARAALPGRDRQRPRSGARVDRRAGPARRAAPVPQRAARRCPRRSGGCASCASCTCCSNRIAALPETIGELRELRQLDLRANALTDVPGLARRR